MYAYCLNNPIMYTDPDGEFVLTALIVGAIIGAVIGLGITVYVDYKDDGEIFNGSVSAGSYVLNTVVGGLVGGITGSICSTSFTFSIPTFNLLSTSIGTTELVIGTSAVTISGTSVVSAIASIGLIMFASNNRPRDNQKQNEQYKEAMRRLGYKKTDWQWRYGHDNLPCQSMGLKELIEFLTDLLGKKK